MQAGIRRVKRFSLPIQIYILLVIASGGAVLLVALPGQIEQSQLVLFGTLAGSGIIAGIHPLPLVGRHATIDLTGAILLMAVFLGDARLAMVLAATVSIVSGLALRRRRLWNTLFNAGTEVLGIGLASALYHGIVPSGELPLDSLPTLAALLLSGGAYWLTNSALVTVLVSARHSQPFAEVYVENWREFYLQCFLLTLLAILGSAAWHQGPAYALMLFVPAVAVYQVLSITKLKQEQVIHATETIAEVLDRRDALTFQHSRRVAEHAVKLSRDLGLSETDVEVLRRAALIHDIGKLGVDDPAEELSPGRPDVTAYQFYSLKQHALLGAMIAREIPAFEEAEEPIRYHHDWYDGTHVSRPHQGEGVPLGARIIAVADSYDRLCMANGEATLACDPLAMAELRTMGGRQLDPGLLARFLRLLDGEQAAQAAIRAPSPVPTS